MHSKLHAKEIYNVTKTQNYYKLLELFAKDRATRDGTVSAKEKVQQWEIESGCNQLQIFEYFDEISCDNFNSQSHNIILKVKTHPKDLK